MRKVIERLQGSRWHNVKKDLILVEYMENQNGHIKGYYVSKEGKIYSHWLNDDEIRDMKEGKKCGKGI